MADEKLRAAQRELAAKVMGSAGVTGTAIGERRGKPCLKVYVDTKEAARRIPRRLGGYPVDVEVTGRFRRL